MNSGHDEWKSDTHSCGAVFKAQFDAIPGFERADAEKSPLTPLSVIPAVFKPESSQMIIGYKSSHPGFVFSINCTFHFRCQPFNRFSRSIADSMLSWSSYETS